MHSFIAGRLALAVRIATLLAAAGSAVAQVTPATSSSTAPRRDPLNAAERVPPVNYRSAIAGHKRHTEQAVGSWRDANDTVTRIGGWRAYAREAAAPEAPPAAPAGHGGHPGHSMPAKP